MATFSSEADARQFLNRVAAWAAASEQALGQAQAEILKQVFLGVALCEDLEQYNARAVAYFQVSNVILRKLREAEIPAPDVAPYPQVFAHDFDVVYGATSDIFPTVNVKLNCTPDGFAQPNLKAGPRPASCGPATPTGKGALGEPISLTIASISAVVITAIAVYGALKIARVFTGADREQVEAEINHVFGEDVLRLAKARNDCIQAGIAARVVPNMRPSDELILRQQIAKDCQKQIPNPPAPQSSGVSFFGFVGALVVVGGLLAGGVYLYRHRAAVQRRLTA